MKIVAINSVNVGSTGNLMLSIASLARSKGHEYYTFSAPGKSMRQGVLCHEFIGSRISRAINYYLGDPFGVNLSIISTIRLCRKLDAIRPDIIHLHNLHGSFINLSILFNYIRRNKIKTIWTLHDCWAFTGRCPHFLMSGCSRWKSGCFDCPFPHDSYPRAILDYSKHLWLRKKKWYSQIEDLTIVTPSHWLAGLVSCSLLSKHPVKVIHNGIDLSVFKPSMSNTAKDIYGINPETKIILGVAFSWGERKGLDIFIELSKILDTGYQIVLIGTNDDIDKHLPKQIVSIHRTNNQKELADLYSLSDVFLNPTREDNFPTTNLEALACGTPVITFKTGGSPESIDPSCGSVLEVNDIFEIKKEIIRVCSLKPYSREDCVSRAREFDFNERIAEYIKIYENTSN